MPALTETNMAASTERAPLFELKNVYRRFSKKQDVINKLTVAMGVGKKPASVHAVDGVDLAINKGEVVGLVGESGCGKSTLGRIVAGIIKPSSGEVLWNGAPLNTLSAEEIKLSRLRTQMIFQNPFASLNPRLSIAEIVGEAPRLHGLFKGGRRGEDEYVDAQLRQAGIDPSLKSRFAHQLSGGQRQRIGIARALAVQPDFLVCDESVAALDVSIQAQILNLFLDLREKLDLTYLFISHDLGVVRHLSDRVAVMYLGRIVEEAPVEDLFERANHPYTQALLQEIPKIDTHKRVFSPIKGELPSPMNPPAGCHFHPRCPFAFDRCKVEAPKLKVIASGHKSACHLNDQQ